MLPNNFVDRMKLMLGDEFHDFLSSYELPEFHALRINTLKADSENIIDKYPFAPVPWSKNGYYYNTDIVPGKHPYHEAGVYYIQEPSAMSPANYLDVKPYDTVLDLCAAPGGKSTQIACKMQGKGLLISNEIHPSRAKVLSENIERMGIKNAIVTNESSESLSKRFPEFFNKIMVDAPCSGEGMFRKNPDACKEWSLDNVELCASRQRDIIHNASLMLKSGGQMVYSTCTFSMEENENTIQYFLNTHPDFELEHIEVAEGLSSGFINDTTRLWPHKLNGEGHFFAVLRKKGASNNSNIEYKTETSISPKEYIECINFLKDNLNISLNGTFIKFGDQIYLVPDNTPSLKGLKIVRSGLHLGTIMKNRFEPSHSLALYLKPENVKKHCNLSSREQTIYDYINGQTFSYTGDKGWYLISVDNYSIGWGKLSGDTMKNHYPKGLRKKLPLTTTFS